MIGGVNGGPIGGANGGPIGGLIGGDGGGLIDGNSIGQRNIRQIGCRVRGGLPRGRGARGGVQRNARGNIGPGDGRWARPRSWPSSRSSPGSSSSTRLWSP